jgi:hypothetical protein
MIAAIPHQGGAAWAALQNLLGLKRVGHDVCSVEPLQEASLRPAGAPLEHSINAAYFRQISTNPPPAGLSAGAINLYYHRYQKQESAGREFAGK